MCIWAVWMEGGFVSETVEKYFALMVRMWVFGSGIGLLMKNAVLMPSEFFLFLKMDISSG